MWTLKSVKASNLQTFERLEFDLSQGVTTLVFGENRDNDVQKSNGSGKSAIIEAVTVGLRGAPMRPVRIDEVINNDETKATTEVRLYNHATKELMVICRDLYKKSSNSVYLYMEKDGKPVPEDTYVQSSSSEYNKFIFDKLGITEDELLNNFILSKHRYKPFLDASDREKKEAINKLSNATIVDPAVEALSEDVKAKEEEIEGIDMVLSGVDGSIEVLTNQIAEHQRNIDENKKEDRLASINKDLAHHNSELIGAKEMLLSLQKIRGELTKAEDVANYYIDNKDNMSVDDISKLFQSHDDETASHTFRSAINEFMRFSDLAKDNIEEAQEELEKLTKTENENNKSIKELESGMEELQKKFNDAENNLSDEERRKDNDIKKLKDKSNEHFKNISETTKLKNNLYAQVSSKNKESHRLKNILLGAIECPKCTHSFFTGDGEDTVEDVSDQLKAVEKDIGVLNKDIKTNEAKIEEIQKHISDIDDEVGVLEEKYGKKIDELDEIRRQAVFNITEADKKLESYKNSNISIQSDMRLKQRLISVQKSNIENSVNDYLDHVFGTNDKDTTRCKQNISFREESINTLNDSIERIKSSNVDDIIADLKEQLASYEEKKGNVNKTREKKNTELLKLKQQYNIFGDFKTYLANSKINALNFEINTFLESVGTDIRIKMDGYSKTKSGKVRDRISISVHRGGIDFGSFAKMSEGEKATVHLATILAMQKLINASAPSTKGLNLLVVDEILDTVDGHGLSHIFDTINENGVTSLIVSHGNIVENYPHKIVVVKEHGISSINS